MLRILVISLVSSLYASEVKFSIRQSLLEYNNTQDTRKVDGEKSKTKDQSLELGSPKAFRLSARYGVFQIETFPTIFILQSGDRIPLGLYYGNDGLKAGARVQFGQHKASGEEKTDDAKWNGSELVLSAEQSMKLDETLSLKFGGSLGNRRSSSEKYSNNEKQESKIDVMTSGLQIGSVYKLNDRCSLRSTVAYDFEQGKDDDTFTDENGDVSEVKAKISSTALSMDLVELEYFF